MKYYIRHFINNDFHTDFIFQHIKGQDLKYLYNLKEGFIKHLEWRDPEFPRNKNQEIYKRIPAIDKELETWEIIKYKLQGII